MRLDTGIPHPVALKLEMRSPLSTLRSLQYRVGHLVECFGDRGTQQRFRLAVERYGTSRERLMLRALALYRIARFTPDESLTRDLVDPKLPLDAHHAHISEEHLHSMQIAVNSPNVAVCRDKLLFHAYCRMHGFPTPELYGVVSNHGSRSERRTILSTEAQWRQFVSELPPAFIVKPRGGNKGRSIQLLGLGLEQVDDAVGSLSNKLRALPDSEDDWLIEQRVAIHERIAELTGSTSVSTVRVVTLIEDGSDPEIMGSHFRVIANDALTDNFNDWATGRPSGNILALPDLDTGIVTEAWGPEGGGLGYRPASRHPRTNLPIEGFAIPYWSDVRRLVQDAAACFLPIRTIGWDVAITPDGPILIEGNEQYQYSSFGPRAVRLREALAREQARLAKLKRSRTIKAAN